MAEIRELYPNLFQKAIWGKIELEFRMDLPESHLISNVNIVPFVNNECVVIRLENGQWEIPGGTLEKGEYYLDTIKRELIEEAGATLHSFHPFGGWKCYSHHLQPYKPHLPHPEFYRIVGYGEVQLVSLPQIPADGEKVVAVESMSVQDAVNKFQQVGRNDLAELYQLAKTIRNSSAK
ncbi:hypothetical protein Back11_14170 [Paenibacillus baekrokdamisoli]|uniref:Uncharacterized protein n=1 Tax=Paenibacillus baekrokdamisoli TaxID=1712516 RepID=A0A3G9IP77_9BACL|nr:NUDIX domain-containing protein [Paenibacillus baekrokdamisoli]MBB3070723.1 8-oxo-dGTP pyrophosphatase MutT (NUDIX family) [Paenibacillus baekrokdamisoli]BBH20072.1 hypothetical protein Back11_14170 [Paenibacillus baekrokdamisoli]